jgi:hypothetical protein
MKRLRGTPFKFSETMAGRVLETPSNAESLSPEAIKRSRDIKVETTILIDDLGSFLENPDHPGRVVGAVTLGGERSEIQNGKFQLFDKDNMNVRHLEYAFEFQREDGLYKFAGKKNVRDDPGSDLLSDMTTLHVQVEGPDSRPWTGAMYFKVSDFISLVASMQAPEEAPPAERILAKTAFLSFCLGKTVDEFLLKKIKI